MVLNLTLILSFITSLIFTDGTVPEFKGGEKKLNTFITNSIIYPEYAKQNCLQGIVYISFQLTKSGRIYNSEVKKGFGVDLDKEALRVVRLTSGRWIVPASFDTTQAMVLPINFALKEYNCNQRSADEIKTAIEAYKTREDLTKAIINFYDKKSSGSYSDKDELTILELKQQLGYNERFFEQLLKQGKQKLKQGDKEGACEDFSLIKKLGSDISKEMLSQNCV